MTVSLGLQPDLGADFGRFSPKARRRSEGVDTGQNDPL